MHEMEVTVLGCLITEGTPCLILFTRRQVTRPTCSQGEGFIPIHPGEGDHRRPFWGPPASRAPTLGLKGTAGTRSVKAGTKALEEH